MGITFEVTEEPQFTVEQLAMQMAEALQSYFDLQGDAVEFSKQIQVESKKIADFNLLISQVDSYRSNPPAKVSRMDPWATYDLDNLHAEIALAQERSVEWKERSETAYAEADAFQKNAVLLKKEISIRNSGR